MEKNENGKKEFEKRTNLRELLNFVTLFGFLYGELDQRLGIKDAIKKNLSKRVPEHVNLSFCFGGITFFLFLICVVTGIFLLMYYRPTTKEAYESIVLITNIVPFGWLMRGLHHWAGTLMIVFVMLHMIRVFYYGAYKPPRDLNWIVGMLLFLLTLFFGFSGYLLPWNQVSYWATTVATDAIGAAPIIGETMKYFVRGGPEVAQLALTRFFAIHVVILPGTVLVLLIAHFGMIRRQGIVGPL